MESTVNKNDVQTGTEKLKKINEDGKLDLAELKSANELNLKKMTEWVKNQRKPEPAKPEASAPYEAEQKYVSELKAHEEMKGVLDAFDAEISALTKSYEASKVELGKTTAGNIEGLKLEVALNFPTSNATAPAASEKEKPAEPNDGRVVNGTIQPRDTGKMAAAPDDANPEKAAPAEYVVKKGDNLTKIAKEYGTTVSELASLNKIKNVNKIAVGQKLIVPNKGTETARAEPENAAPEAPKAVEKAAEGKSTDKVAENKNGKAAEKNADTKPAYDFDQLKEKFVAEFSSTPKAREARTETKPNEGNAAPTVNHAGAPKKSDKA